MSKYVFAAAAVLLVLGTVAAYTPEFEELARKHGALAPDQRLPEEGGFCDDILGRWQCPRYQYFRNGVGFEFREYAPSQAIVCTTGPTTPGRIYENLFPCYRSLDDYFIGQNAAGLRINRTAPVGVEVYAPNSASEYYTVIFWLPEALTKPPEPRSGSPILLVEVPPFAVLSATFGPTDLWGQFGPNEGDYQVYDAAGILTIRAYRRGYPIVPGVFIFGTYSAPPAAERRANLRHEVWVGLNLTGEAMTMYQRSQLRATPL